MGATLDETLQPGSRVNDRFMIIDVIGSGGAGVVVHAVDLEHGNRDVAVKLLHKESIRDETVVARFQNEVAVMRTLSHPNIVEIYEEGMTESGHRFLVMEYIKGKSLREQLDVKPFSLVQGSQVLYKIARAVAHAHKKGIIHRDLKPENVLLSDEGEVKVTDFGLARTVSGDLNLTKTGEVVGTAYYMAPEQVCGDELDQRCDVYALGIMSYELVIGERPFEANSWFEVARRQCFDPLPALAGKGEGVPCWYEDFVSRAAAKNREDRMEDAGEFAETLKRFVDFRTAQSGVMARAREFLRPDGTLCTMLASKGFPRRRIAGLVIGACAVLVVIYGVCEAVRF